MGGKSPPDNSQMMMQMRMDENKRADAVEERRRQELVQKEAQQAAQREADKGASQQRVQAAYQSALQAGRQKLQMKGVGADEGRGADVMSMLTSALDSVRAGAPEIVQDASTLFGPQQFDNAYNDVRSQYKNQLGKQLDQFAGSGFEYERFADTSDDDILNSIVGSQYTDADETLQRALARGQINEAGYGYAGKELGRQQSAANSRAQDFGGGVLQGYRDQLSGLGTQFRDKINNTDLADNFNFDVKRGRIDDMYNNLSGRMEGDIYNAIGDYSFFNTDSLLGKAANRSGTMNNNTQPNVASTGGTQNNIASLFEQDKDKNTGTTGAF